MARSGLTLSILFEAESANYGEGFGNITVLKKLGRDDRKQYTYISRQALRYNMMQQLGWDNTPVTAQNKVVQFAPEATIDQYPEIDLFGYLKTSAKTENEKGGSNKRSAVVRLSNAIALEAYRGDMDYLTNMGLAAREKLENAIAQSEIHKSIYAYTITIDLDRVGIDGTINLDKKEKARRVKDFLDTVQFLYRDIKGRRENLNPIFAVGGVYQRKNPYFENRLKLSEMKLNADILLQILDSNEDTKHNSLVGSMSSVFANDQEIHEKLKPVSITEVFNKLKSEVDAYYE
ncbi:MAG: cas7i [Firmicutes bacterium]|nr:cas7i [Bacillota bacterium]